MIANWLLAVAPSTEPVSLAEAKLHLRVDHTSEDTLITALIRAARIYVEEWMRRALITQEWNAYLDCFPRCNYIQLPMPRLRSATSLSYTDTAGVTTIWTASGDPSSLDLVSGATVMAHVDTGLEPGRIVLAYGQSWPTATLRTSSPIAIHYTAGYGAASDVPENIKHAILLMIAHLYQNREAVVVGDKSAIDSKPVQMAVNALLSSEKIWTF